MHVLVSKSIPWVSMVFLMMILASDAMVGNNESLEMSMLSTNNNDTLDNSTLAGNNNETLEIPTLAGNNNETLEMLTLTANGTEETLKRNYPDKDPYYPGYSLREKKRWRIVAPEGEHVLITIKDLFARSKSLENSLSIYDGDFTDDQRVRRLNSRDEEGRMFVSSSNVFSIIINYTDGWGHFTLTYQIYNASSPSEGCNGTAMVLKATYKKRYLVSPGYPLAYPSNSKCTWIIETNLDKVYLKVEFIDLDSDERKCRFDILNIRGMRASNGASICNSQPDSNMIFSSSAYSPFVVNFISDSNFQGKGFRISYSASRRSIYKNHYIGEGDYPNYPTIKESNDHTKEIVISSGIFVLMLFTVIIIISVIVRRKRRNRKQIISGNQSSTPYTIQTDGTENGNLTIHDIYDEYSHPSKQQQSDTSDVKRDLNDKTHPHYVNELYPQDVTNPHYVNALTTDNERDVCLDKNTATAITNAYIYASDPTDKGRYVCLDKNNAITHVYVNDPTRPAITESVPNAHTHEYATIGEVKSKDCTN